MDTIVGSLLSRECKLSPSHGLFNVKKLNLYISVAVVRYFMAPKYAYFRTTHQGWTQHCLSSIHVVVSGGWQES